MRAGRGAAGSSRIPETASAPGRKWAAFPAHNRHGIPNRSGTPASYLFVFSKAPEPEAEHEHGWQRWTALAAAGRFHALRAVDFDFPPAF